MRGDRGHRHDSSAAARIWQADKLVNGDYPEPDLGVGGDLIHRLQQHLALIGHLQCGAVPSRHEPDEGEVNYPAVFEAVDALGYQGWIGAEYRPRGRTEDGLGWARRYGVRPAG